MPKAESIILQALGIDAVLDFAPVPMQSFVLLH
jgi:hypothetical protein